jgi:ribosomal protein L3 glutamine methyltransferase
LASNSLFTVLDWVRYACTRFTSAERSGQLAYGHGCLNAFDEAVWLVLASLHLPLDQFTQFSPARLTSAEAELVHARINERIKERKPLAYILGEAWLLGERFIADERALVPRSLIAELLESGLDPWLDDQTDPNKILDLCTGGGSLAIFCALHFPDARITGSDISKDALALAKENIELHRLGENISLVHSDLFAKLKGKFDLIVSNPPYVNSTSMKRLPPEFLAEPNNALEGGPDGMALIGPMLAQASKFLTNNGLLVVELGHEVAFFEAAFPRLEVTWLPTSGGDQAVFAVTASALRHQ